jgi:hypothetical protein
LRVWFSSSAGGWFEVKIDWRGARAGVKCLSDTYSSQPY